jgi:hypothetical protein
MADVMKLEDVIHFYLGCEVEYEGILNGKELKAEQVANKHDIFYIPKVEKVIGKKRGFLKQIYHAIDGTQKYKIGRRGLQSHYNCNRFKPILRPLSSMTEQEATELATIHKYDIPEDEGVREELIDIYTFDDGVLRIGTTYLPGKMFIEGLRYLLSRGFDLFSLIENNLAIDADTLKEHV